MLRAPGLFVLGTIVGLGLASGAAYYHYKQPKLAAELEAKLASAPKTPRGLLEQWHLYGAPQIHHRLSKFARFSAELPYLVTHAVDLLDGGEPEIFGIDCEALPRELSHLEGMQVVVELPAVRALGRASLRGEQARSVPLYRRGEALPDPNERLRSLALFFLDRIPGALAEDIEGASLEIRVMSGSTPVR